MSNAEKRSVHTDALETLGKIISESERRDAIHLAVNPTQAKTELKPGQDVGVDGSTKNPVGIVDPFLKENVKEGEWFWLVVYPRQITSLRHVWCHPSFPDTDVSLKYIVPPAVIRKEESEKWLKEFVKENDCPSYAYLLETIEENNSSERLHFDGQDAHGEIPPEFWLHAENILGHKIDYKPSYFSCSC